MSTETDKEITKITGGNYMRGEGAFSPEVGIWYRVNLVIERVNELTKRVKQLEAERDQPK